MSISGGQKKWDFVGKKYKPIYDDPSLNVREWWGKIQYVWSLILDGITPKISNF